MTQQMSRFTKNQAGAIYRAMKEGRVEMSAEAVSEMYDLVNDGSGIDWNGSSNSSIQQLRIAVDAIFDGDYERAQGAVDRFAGVKAEGEPEDDEAETYTTTTGVTYVYWEMAEGFGFYEKGDATSEDELDYIETEAELFDYFEKANEWRAA